MNKIMSPGQGLANVRRGRRSPARPKGTCRRCWHGERLEVTAVKRGLCIDCLEA